MALILKYLRSDTCRCLSLEDAWAEKKFQGTWFNCWIWERYQPNKKDKTTNQLSLNHGWRSHKSKKMKKFKHGSNFPKTPLPDHVSFSSLSACPSSWTCLVWYFFHRLKWFLKIFFTVYLSIKNLIAIDLYVMEKYFI